jgi:putative GTP pyrophosphokinase
MAFSAPPNSKSAVRRSGNAIALGRGADGDFQLVDQWRSSHGYVINTFQAWLKGHFAKQTFNIEFAQRLKRRNTVMGKLLRRDVAGKPLISDVASMHDFAGCRMIFDNLDDLITFRNYMHSTSVTRSVDHEVRHALDLDKYNYIERPKSSGYRGIHDVYRHFPRGSKRREQKKPWDGLLVEIQYRTRAQHAWATAVEISDLLDNEQTKFELEQSSRGLFFAIASEIIARQVEKLNKAFLTQSTNELRSKLQELEDELGILRRLKVLRRFEVEKRLQRHNVLNIYRGDDGNPALEVLTFKSPSAAILRSGELEADPKSLNAVYVRSDNPQQLRSAYRNYFNDPIDFVELIEQQGDLKS